MNVRQKKNNADEFYISCVSYPNCKNAVWLPTIVKKLEVLSETCPVVSEILISSYNNNLFIKTKFQ